MDKSRNETIIRVIYWGSQMCLLMQSHNLLSQQHWKVSLVILQFIVGLSGQDWFVKVSITLNSPLIIQLIVLKPSLNWAVTDCISCFQANIPSLPDLEHNPLNIQTCMCGKQWRGWLSARHEFGSTLCHGNLGKLFSLFETQFPHI